MHTWQIVKLMFLFLEVQKANQYVKKLILRWKNTKNREWFSLPYPGLDLTHLVESIHAACNIQTRRH